MKREKKLWRRAVPAVAFGMSLSFAVLVHTPANADESYAAAESSEEANQITLTQGDTQAVAALAPAVNLTALAASPSAGEDFEDDPFESFNEKMFWFNREVLDRYVLKPIATGWDFLLPDPVQRGVHNFFDNLAVVRRVVNNSLQLKFNGAGTELARFTINSTVGVVGFFDVAKDAFGIEQRDEDTGQTFGVWGAGPGPYLVLPFLPPLTIRDGIGYAFDVAMTPYTYFIPWWASVAGTATSTVNERSLNLDRFERVAESTVDLYGAVRNGYLQRRAAAIKQ
ncbi:MAG TPA: VacJ family lipoprotein [Candidatus Eisenbacteria bacterium]|jgi:phospholipid-binding lipoprotein MlaA|nr:VacJ family lipoprotein [Candidatus Eisenbacteria bacterium]